MTNKVILSSSIILLVLSSCTSIPTREVGHLYDEDLTKLVSGPYIEIKAPNSMTSERYDISYTESKTTSDNFLYTIKINYKNESFPIRAILLPGSDFNSATSKNLSYFGYTKDVMYLTQTHEDNFHYANYKLQVEKKEKESSLYVSVSYANDLTDLYKIEF